MWQNQTHINRDSDSLFSFRVVWFPSLHHEYRLLLVWQEVTSDTGAEWTCQHRRPRLKSVQCVRVQPFGLNTSNKSQCPPDFHQKKLAWCARGFTLQMMGITCWDLLHFFSTNREYFQLCIASYAVAPHHFDHNMLFQFLYEAAVHIAMCLDKIGLLYNLAEGLTAFSVLFGEF